MGEGVEDVGVYIHVPFCERICPYCDFAVVAAQHLPEELEARYVEALVLMAVAGASDALDGWLARRFGWISRFGAAMVLRRRER